MLWAKSPFYEGIEGFFIEVSDSPSRYSNPLKTVFCSIFPDFGGSATSFATKALILGALVNLMKDNSRSEFPYKKCMIRDRNGDLSKRWYVEFYVWDIATERLVRKTDYSFNRFPTAKERYQEAAKIKAALDAALEKGSYIDTSGVQQAPKAPPPIT